MNMWVFGMFLLAVLLAAVLGVVLWAQWREKAHLLRDAERLRAEKSAAEEARAAAENEVRNLLAQQTELKEQLAAQKAASEVERRNAEAQRAAERQEREKAEETMRLQFKELANQILGEQSQHLRKTHAESLDILLKPFRDNITDFRKRVEEIYTVQTSQSGELKAELKNLMELNRTISTDAQNLTNALKGNSKVQGDWGEMLLETILDSSALTKGIHYETQYNVKDDEGRNQRPDVVLRLPDQKAIVIDSKVSLTAFVAYTAAEQAADRERHLQAHVDSVRRHVTELGRKEYQRRFDSPDFVILFVPNEPAFLEALKADPEIWSDAYDKKVIISSPTNLFALLKLVADLWKYHAQDKNTREIATCALKLYEQAAAFATSLEGVGTALDKARGAYEDARKRLTSGNDNILRLGTRLQKTARLQSKKQFPARMLDEAGVDLPDEPSEEKS